MIKLSAVQAEAAMEAFDETFVDGVTFIRGDDGEWVARISTVGHKPGWGRVCDQTYWQVMDEDELIEQLDYYLGLAEDLQDPPTQPVQEDTP